MRLSIGRTVPLSLGEHECVLSPPLTVRLLQRTSGYIGFVFQEDEEARRSRIAYVRDGVTGVAAYDIRTPALLP